MAPNAMPRTPDLKTAIRNVESALDELKSALGSGDTLPASTPAPSATFEALRAWRTEQARAKQVPPYIVATDAVLRAIEETRPQDIATLGAVRGFGQTKAQEYGEAILAVVKQA